MTDCPNGEVRDLLPDLLHDRLTPAQRAEVEDHLLSCEDCQEEMALLRGMRRSMHRAPKVAVADIVSALPAYRAPVRRLGNGWRIAAALALIVGGGTSIIVRHDARVLEGNHALVAVIPTTPAAPATPVETQVASATVHSTPAHVERVAPETQAAPRELAVASTNVGDLSDAELDALVNDLGSLDAVTPAEVEQPASVSPLPPTSTSETGA